MFSLLLLFFALLIGYLARLVLDEKRSESLSLWIGRYVIYIALPAMILVYIPDIKIDTSILLPVFSAWGLFAFSSISIIVVGRLMSWKREVVGALLFTIPYGNTSFLGVPFTKSFFGDPGLPYTLIYDQLGSFLILSTIGVVVLALYTAKQATLSKIIIKIITFPAFIALVVSFYLQDITFPNWLGDSLSFLSATLSPFAMISIGLQLKLRFESHEKLPFWYGIFIKLILSPILLLLLFKSLQIGGLAGQISIFEAGMAPMVSSSMVAILAKLNPKFVASVLGYGIVISFVTLPLVYWMATSFVPL